MQLSLEWRAEVCRPSLSPVLERVVDPESATFFSVIKNITQIGGEIDMRKVNFNEQVSVKITSAQRKWIDDYANNHETTIGETVRLLINTGMKQLKQ